MPDDAPQTGQPWEVRDSQRADKIAYSVERGTGRDTEYGAVCWDYGVACIIEAALNLRDGTVE